MKIRTWFATLVSASLAGMIGYFWLRDQALPPMLGIACTLMFCSFTLLGVAALMPARQPVRTADGATLVPLSRTRCALSGAGLVGFGIACIAMVAFIGGVTSDWRTYVFWVLPAPALYFGYLYFRVARSAEPAYRIDANGVTRYHWGARTVPWREVERVRRITYSGNSALILDVPSLSRKPVAGWQRMLFGTGAFGISGGTSGVPVDALEPIVRGHWERAVSR